MIPWRRSTLFDTRQRRSRPDRLVRKRLTILWVVVSAALMISSGCNAFKSRYAMSDPVYAKKYAEGAERGDLLGKLKQSIDARHVEGLLGNFVGGGTIYRPKSDNTLGGADIGHEYYPTSYLSQRLGIGLYASEDEGYLAADVGMRAQLPSRITPFVGAGALLGASRSVEDATHDNMDNDDDGMTDEYGEETSGVDELLAAIYPEVGLHAWLNGKWRATAFGRYLITDNGREHDDWMIGGQITFFPRRQNP